MPKEHPRRLCIRTSNRTSRPNFRRRKVNLKYLSNSSLVSLSTSYFYQNYFETPTTPSSNKNKYHHLVFHISYDLAILISILVHIAAMQSYSGPWSWLDFKSTKFSIEYSKMRGFSTNFAFRHLSNQFFRFIRPLESPVGTKCGQWLLRMHLCACSTKKNRWKY